MTDREDKDRLIELFKKTEYTPFPEMTMTANLGNQFTDYGLNCIVDNLLANDVVEVVRCEDCEYWGGITFGNICRRWSGLNVKNCTKPTDYCSYGELKELKDNA